MDEILRQAADLGRAIAKSPRALDIAAARQAIEADAGAQALLRAHEAAVERIQKLRSTQQPIEPEDKRRLAEAEAELAGHALFKSLLKAQADFIELMTRVNAAIEAPLRPRESGSADAAGGGRS
ncbi:MAG: YlbF family regulator [Phycisphaerae bacterium]|nr:YlbF family regulator [Phycisphaerae bacterium]